MKAKIPKVRTLTAKERSRAATWHAKKMRELVDKYGSLALNAWMNLNTMSDLKHEILIHVGEFERMTKGKP